MNADSIRPGLTGDDDSWEALARDLLGVEIDRPAPADDVVEDLPYPESSLPPGPAWGSWAAPAEAQPDPSAADVKHDRPESEGEPVAESTGDDESAESAAEPAAEKAEESAPDSYWDALQDWDWDSDAESSPRAESPRARGDRSSARRGPREDRRDRPASPSDRPAATSDRPSPRVPETRPNESLRQDFIDDAEFGAGLVDDLPAAPRAPEKPRESVERSVPVDRTSPVKQSRDEEAPCGDEEGRRRRRRRRRSRDRDRPDMEHPSEPERTATDDDFATDTEVSESPGAAAEESGESAETEARRRRRRRRRRRGEPSAHAGETADLAEPSDLAEEDFASAPYGGLSGEDDESGERDEDSAPSYRNVPTWEEAIGYLTRRQPGTALGQEGSSHSGRRRRRR